MAERTYFSRHIRKSDMAADDVRAVEADIRMFNRIKWKAAAMEEVRNTSDRKAVPSGKPDLRKRENRSLRDASRKSVHLQLKEEFHADDHFVNSAVNAAKGMLQSAKELNRLNLEECGKQLKGIRKKRSSLKGSLTRLTHVKQMLIEETRNRQAGKPADWKLDGFHERYCPETGCFAVLSFGKVRESFANTYLFEVKYVDPGIRRLKQAVRELDEKEGRLNRKMDGMRKKEPGICYGTKKLFRRQNDTARYPDHDVWRKAFRRKRSHAFQISGRKDAAQGNFRFRYDRDRKTVTYRSQQTDKSGRPIRVRFPGVEFPYGQENVRKALDPDTKKEDRSAVAWSVEDTGGSFLLRCTVHVQSPRELNTYYGNGCVSMDSNYDNISIAELDGSGNVLRHKVIRFRLEGLTSGRAEQVLSGCLDEVFRICDSTKKPFAMENLKLKHVAEPYGPKRRNFVTGRFAFSKITSLAEGKALRHSVEIRKVNPAYTSQAGKLLFVKKYGMSIHEAASAVIGRRAMGIREKLPEKLRKGLKDDRKNRSRMSQWAAAYRVTKGLKAEEMYGYSFAV